MERPVSRNLLFSSFDVIRTLISDILLKHFTEKYTYFDFFCREMDLSRIIREILVVVQSRRSLSRGTLYIEPFSYS